MVSFDSTLSPLQRELLHLLGEIPEGYVTGGTALAGYLGHRQSLDIDFFMSDARDVEAAGAMLLSAGKNRGLTVRELRRFPGFRRYEVQRGEESTLVDIVHEVVSQIVPLEAKPVRDGVRVDSLEDLVANKLCAVLGRSEVKDLVDLFFLADSGLDVLDHMPAAATKDGGMEPATLAYVLKHAPTDPSDLLLLRQVDSAALAAFRDGLVSRLLTLAWPE